MNLVQRGQKALSFVKKNLLSESASVNFFILNHQYSIGILLTLKIKPYILARLGRGGMEFLFLLI